MKMKKNKHIGDIIIRIRRRIIMDIKNQNQNQNQNQKVKV